MKKRMVLFFFLWLGITVSLPAQCISGNCHTGSGVFIYPSGARYIGAFVDGRREGMGTCYYSDGSRYFGFWQRDRTHGEGILTSTDGRETRGEWYRGQLREERADLSFLQTGQERSPQTGCLSGNCTNGQGVLVYPDGNVYSGDFQQGKRHGFGECYFAGGSLYKGRWQNDLPDGNGTMTETDGTRKTGLWSRGKLLAEEGRIAVQPPAARRAREGCLVGNCENGIGTYVFPDKSRYEGSFRNGLPHGQGRVFYVNGQVYEGRLEKGMLHGQGKMTSRDGRVVAGYWEDGAYVQSLTTETNVPAGQSAEEPRVRIWAVVVGIAAYPHMPPLFYTDDDAYQFYAFLKSPEGGAVPDHQLRLLIDENATRSRILEAMSDVFRKAGPNDVAILYFSGHGKPGAFLPYDNNGEFNKVYHQEITRVLEASPAKVKLCIADACHSGGMFASRSSASTLSTYYNYLAQAQPGCALILSSKSDETSLEARDVRQGVFSHFMIRGLKGEADADNDQVVTIMEVFNYVYHRVRQYTNNRQSPIIKGDFDRNMPIGTVRQ